MATSEVAFEFLETGDHHKIIYGALKKLGVRPNHDRYQDLAQDGWVYFTEIYEKYPSDPVANRKPFLAYAHQALYRRFLNDLQKTKRHSSHVIEEEVDMTTVAEAGDMVSDQIDAALFEEWLSRCQGVERRYLIDAVQLQMTPTEIAEKWHVSRQTVYRWRDRVKKRLMGVWD